MLCVPLQHRLCSSKATFIFRRAPQFAPALQAGSRGQSLTLPAIPLPPSLCRLCLSCAPRQASLLCLQPHTSAVWAARTREEDTHCLPPRCPLDSTLFQEPLVSTHLVLVQELFRRWGRSSREAVTVPTSGTHRDKVATLRGGSQPSYGTSP